MFQLIPGRQLAALGLAMVMASFLEAADPDLIKASASKSIALLQPCDETFFNNTGCLACHQQSVTALAVAEARKHGLNVDEEAARQQQDLIRVVLARSRSRKLQRVESPFAQPVTVGYYALAFDAQGYEPDENTDAMVLDMAARQTAEGFWVASSHRPPMEFSQVSSTALAVKTMQLYGPPAYREQFRHRMAKARQWLEESTARGNEEEVFKLLGLSWSDADRSIIDLQWTRLAEQQREDGGWAQLPHLESDAYATAMAMIAFHQAGMQPGDPVYQSAVEFLMRTQLDDGSWHVKSRSEPVQKYFESGFPHGPDQWISATATGWASVALLRSLDE